MKCEFSNAIQNRTIENMYSHICDFTEMIKETHEMEMENTLVISTVISFIV